MDPLLRQLEGGDRRSTGAAAAVLNVVSADPSRFPILLEGMTAPDPLVRMRCSDVIEKLTADRPELLRPYKNRLIQLAREAQQQEVRWHLAQILPRVPLSSAGRGRVLEILTEYLKDKSRIVRTFSMQAMADIAGQESRVREPVLRRLEELTRSGSPAMRSRGRRLLAQLKH